MQSYHIWREKNKTHLYELYQIFFNKVSKFNDELTYLNSLKSRQNELVYNLPDGSFNLEYFQTQEFIDKFIDRIYKSSSKRVSYFD